MADFVFGTHGMEGDILDFANYVFSQAHRPHDFRQIWPKVYARDDFAPLHALAMEKGRIRGMLALLPGTLRVGDGLTLATGYLGTMGVHPYARGGGWMRALFDMVMRRAAELDLDVLALDGRRHRYNHFGFERAGLALSFLINADCVKHALKDVDDAGVELSGGADGMPPLSCLYPAYRRLDMVGEREDLCAALQSGQAQTFLVRREGQAVGYLNVRGGTVAEMALPEDAVAPALKAYIRLSGAAETRVLVGQHEARRIETLRPLAESYAVSDRLMLRVRSWPRVLSTLLRYKARFSPVEDGHAALGIEGCGPLALDVRNGAVSVCPTEEAPRLSLAHNEAVSLLFSPMTAFRPLAQGALPASWLPLPFSIPWPDAF